MWQNYRIVPNLSPPLIIAQDSLAMIQEKMEILDELRINFILKLKKDLNMFMIHKIVATSQVF